MCVNHLELFKPRTVINFDIFFSEGLEILGYEGFKYKADELSGPIIYGTAWLDELDQVTLHLSFNANTMQIESIMIICDYMSTQAELEGSFLRKEKLLNQYYGDVTKVIDNPPYKEGNTERQSGSLKIEHFIKDRFGDQEGICIYLRNN